MPELLTINGVELYWDESGQGHGPPLVLCHGFTGSVADFTPVIPKLATGRRVMALEQRGHGRSTNLGELDGYSLDLLADDLIAFIEHVGGGDPVDLLGHSMGGRVALGVVLARPDLIHSLILMDTSAWSFQPEDGAVRSMIADFMAEFDPADGLPTIDLRGPEDDLVEAATAEDLLTERERIRGCMDPYAMKALGAALLVDGIVSVRDRLGEITCPTTVLVGSLDTLLAAQAPELAAGVADGRLSTIEGGYHSPQLTHPEEWLAAVDAHLDWANA